MQALKMYSVVMQFNIKMHNDYGNILLVDSNLKHIKLATR
jgi:hypothetical protein